MTETRKLTRPIWALMAVAALATLMVGCSVAELLPSTSGEPTADLAATVEAQVAATLAAHEDQAPAQPTATAPSYPPPAQPTAAAQSYPPPAAPTAAVQSYPPPAAPTPGPTVDPYPPLALPFSDNFGGGISSAWRVVGGNPVVKDGKLGSARGEEVILEIGNGALRDYRVEFTLSDDEYGWGGYNSALYLLLTPSLQVKLYSADVQTRIYWLAFEDNSWQEITRTDQTSTKVTNFVVEVLGNSYRVFTDGQNASELVYGPVRPSGAPLVMRIQGNDFWVDDFSIR